MPRVPERAPKPLTDDEVEALLGIGEPHARVIRLGLGTALRWGDLCRVEAKDLKRDAGGWCLEVAVGKTGKVLRVPVTDPALVQDIRASIGRLVPFSLESDGSLNKAVRRRSGVGGFDVHRLRPLPRGGRQPRGAPADPRARLDQDDGTLRAAAARARDGGRPARRGSAPGQEQGQERGQQGGGRIGRNEIGTELPACHAGGRGFESRQPRHSHDIGGPQSCSPRGAFRRRRSR